MTNKAHLVTYLETQSKAIATLLPKATHRLGGKAVHQLRVVTR